MIFELKIKKDKLIEKTYKKSMKELGEFFKINWIRNTPKVIIVKTRKEIDKLKGYKTPGWIIAWANMGTIYLLDPKSYKKESSHVYSEKKFVKTIKHELCHLFFGIATKANNHDQFIWFNEGVAGFLSEQYKDKPKPKKFEKFLSQYSTWKEKPYNESSHAVKYLAKEFGKAKLLELIKSLSTVKSEKDFNRLFKKIYGSNPTYRFFNKLLRSSK